ncbi:sn-glycerol-3-phosphate ABC transporter ATP-binding protein UgpC [Mesorhizobium sp. YIM 152430]|uniref:ABC transporter ATP-binding protein n=1 Tax=Mesorhizobium sp. YIM 152430 TaxID=3031761 RepID=UPI0023DB9363|nr:sn-glycerol-3-phosphate ABC transporter ATP-binding protein UgpC [Mesorhizobium sp. YIM 152430]MDF1598909.1 sn-glycerol-3-phosphate ABC transporter ATP-binding protein UgpC [Mesorhizobium sp. YIM 152430]
MAELVLTDLHKSFGATEVIRGVSLEASSGEFIVFVGPSGCGKSTLLRMIAGLEETTAGKISIDDRDVTKVDPAKRGIAMVFQTYALYPHMSVAENMGFGLEMSGMGKAERMAKVRQAAASLHLTDYLDRKPKQLSGGQRQRVAIGRAIVRDPKVFLFDEPLSNLDAELRVKMRLEIARLHKDLGATMVYVTHDQVEAMTLADKIVVLRDGLVEQIGRPLELYENPDNVFVAGFIGSPRMNFFPATVTGRQENHFVVDIPALRLSGVPVRARAMPEDRPETITIGIRPEHLSEAAGSGFSVRVVCQAMERLGSVSYLHASLTEETQITAELRDARDVQPGDAFELFIEPSRIFAFDAAGARL